MEVHRRVGGKRFGVVRDDGVVVLRVGVACAAGVAVVAVVVFNDDGGIAW